MEKAVEEQLKCKRIGDGKHCGGTGNGSLKVVLTGGCCEQNFRSGRELPNINQRNARDPSLVVSQRH